MGGIKVTSLHRIFTCIHATTASGAFGNRGHQLKNHLGANFSTHMVIPSGKDFEEHGKKS